MNNQFKKVLLLQCYDVMVVFVVCDVINIRRRVAHCDVIISGNFVLPEIKGYPQSKRKH